MNLMIHIAVVVIFVEGSWPRIYIPQKLFLLKLPEG